MNRLDELNEKLDDLINWASGAKDSARYGDYTEMQEWLADAQIALDQVRDLIAEKRQWPGKRVNFSKEEVKEFLGALPMSPYTKARLEAMSGGVTGTYSET